MPGGGADDGDRSEFISEVGEEVRRGSSLSSSPRVRRNASSILAGRVESCERS